MADTSTRLARRPLTAREVASFKEPGKYPDAHGLFLLVRKGGTRSWVQRLTVRGRRRDVGLGSADLVTLAEARAAALDNRRLARAGGDPMQARRESKAVLTFEEATRKVHALHKPTWRNDKHAQQFLSTLEAYAFPRVGKLRIPDVTPADVLAVLTPIWTKTPETARRVHQRVSTVLKWGVAQGWRTDNPAATVTQGLPKHDRAAKGQRKALPYGEVAAALGKVQASEAFRSTKLALGFLVLTAARSGEVRGAAWEEFELGDAGGTATPATPATWTVPAARMKAGRVHRVPLSGPALAVLREARKLGDGTGLVFPGARKGAPLSDATMSKLLRELAIPADVHGFRTSFRTWAQERTNFPREVAEAALAHTLKDKVEAAYARSDLFEKRRKMMEAWAAYLALTREEAVPKVKLVRASQQ